MSILSGIPTLFRKDRLDPSINYITKEAEKRQTKNNSLTILDKLIMMCYNILSESDLALSAGLFCCLGHFVKLHVTVPSEES